ncbi:hypothetical protein M8623_003411 [Salmonella enterica subsp. enterica]|nr:hypothetical protein [Salmonella enterica subsp. enterica]
MLVVPVHKKVVFMGIDNTVMGIVMGLGIAPCPGLFSEGVTNRHTSFDKDAMPANGHHEITGNNKHDEKQTGINHRRSGADGRGS